MGTQNSIAICFLAIKPKDFSYTIYRRFLSDQEEAVAGTRYLPTDLSKPADRSAKRGRYAISFVEMVGYEKVTVQAWTNTQLTVEVLQNALLARVQNPDLNQDVEISENLVYRNVAFVIKRHEEGIREVMRLNAYNLKIAGALGFRCGFHLSVPQTAEITERRRLELGLTLKNGRTNESYYLDQYQKVGDFLDQYHAKLATLELHDGTRISLDRRLTLVPSFTLQNRTYVFANGKEAGNRFFGLRDNGPYEDIKEKVRLAFLFTPEDRGKSQELYKALRGDTYSTFPGMHKLFRTPIGNDNVTGAEVVSFEPADLNRTCLALKDAFPDERLVPIVVAPFTKHQSAEETMRYARAKHVFLTAGLASQFVDRTKTMGDHNALKWSISNIGLAVYAKMGGQPWKVKPSTENCLIVGIGQAHRKVGDRIEKYVAYSVLTDSSGTYENIRVLGSSTDHEEYVASLKANLREVLTSHQNRYSSFVLHVTFKPRDAEIHAIKTLLDKLRTESENHEFVVIKFNDQNDFFGFSTEHNSKVPLEGTVARLSKQEFLVWFSGVSTGDSSAPKKSERPVHVKILYPDTPLPDDTLRRLLQDTVNIAGANWRGFNAKSMPISVYYAKLVADYYSRFREAGLEDVSFDNVSPWFL
ncbi:MAG: hypothetical protein KF843_11185 [Flavobacteriales bacterium]|nr:hypothetical protein [Flavobacteriales bacterium]